MATKKKPRATAARPAFKYKNRYGLIIELPGEREQRRHYNRLRRLGYAPKVVVV